MLKKIATSLFGTRHAREMKRVQPIVDAINLEYERLHSVSEEELRGQTAKLRAIVAERAKPLEDKIAALREQKHSTPDAADRERIDREISGADGKGGLEEELR
jgi:preprotein translocase subunit SecA